MSSSDESLASWEMYSDDQLPHAIIYTDVHNCFDRMIKIISNELIQLAEICRPLDVTFEFVPRFLLISTAEIMKRKIDQLYPVVSRIAERLNRL